jgi:carbamoyltransferase
MFLLLFFSNFLIQIQLLNDFFEMDVPSPYMLLVAPVKQDRCKGVDDQDRVPIRERIHQIRSDVPAITHVDYSARVQTVSPETNKRYYDIIKAFEARTGYGIVINTSFNYSGEPIVHTPQNAIDSAKTMNLDAVVINNEVIYL